MFHIPPRKSCRLRDKVEIYGRARQATDENIIWRMRIAFWMNKAADTLGICNTAFPQQRWLRESASIFSLYVRCLSGSLSFSTYMGEWAGIAQSVQKLTPGWTVWNTSAGGARFSATVQSDPKAHTASDAMIIGSLYQG